LWHIIDKALAKDRRARYQTASELQDDLRGLAQHTIQPKPVTTHLSRILGAGGTTLVASAILVTWLITRQSPVPPELHERRLTANPDDNPVTGAVISPDGKYVAYSDDGGIHIRLTATGEARTIPQTESWTVTSWFPDGTKVLADGDPAHPGVWAISVWSGTRHNLHARGGSGLVSPDGSQLHTANTPSVSRRFRKFGSWERADKRRGRF
jgi:WD40 repeat protein